MPSFTVRIELHHASETDYHTLHEEMEGRKFLRKIKDSEGVWHQLPTAEYNYVEEGLTKYDALKLAKEAASVTNRKYWVLVTESAGRTWANLPEIDE